MSLTHHHHWWRCCVEDAACRELTAAERDCVLTLIWVWCSDTLQYCVSDAEEKKMNTKEASESISWTEWEAVPDLKDRDAAVYCRESHLSWWIYIQWEDRMTVLSIWVNWLHSSLFCWYSVRLYMKHLHSYDSQWLYFMYWDQRRLLQNVWSS